MNTIVLGTNHNNTLGIVWSLGEAKHTITLLLYDDGNNYVSKSKYVVKTILIHKNEDVIELLKLVSSEMEEKPVVLVSNDSDATLLNEHYEDLRRYCFIEGGGSNGSVNKYRDKDIGNLLAKKCGLSLPEYLVVGSKKEINYDRLNYPVFVKVNNSIHGGKCATKKCDSRDVAEHFISNLPKEYFPIQIQEFINKDYEIMLLGCSLYCGKDVFCPVANKKIRQYPKNVGLGTWSESIEVSRDEELKELAKKIAYYVGEIGYTGNFSAEFLYRAGKYYFLEVNLRNDGTSYLSTASGYNLPDMVCRSFVEDKISIEAYKFRKKNYLYLFSDFHYVLDKSVGLIEWFKQFNENTCYSHYNKHDKKPFWFYLKSIIKQMKKR